MIREPPRGSPARTVRSPRTAREARVRRSRATRRRADWVAGTRNQPAQAVPAVSVVDSGAEAATPARFARLFGALLTRPEEPWGVAPDSSRRREESAGDSRSLARPRSAPSEAAPPSAPPPVPVQPSRTTSGGTGRATRDTAVGDAAPAKRGPSSGAPIDGGLQMTAEWLCETVLGGKRASAERRVRPPCRISRRRQDHRGPSAPRGVRRAALYSAVQPPSAASSSSSSSKSPARSTP